MRYRTPLRIQETVHGFINMQALVAINNLLDLTSLSSLKLSTALPFVTVL